MAWLLASTSLVLAALVVGACSPPPRESVDVAVHPAPPGTSRAPHSPPSPSAASSASAEETRAPLPVRSSTPGKIQCETLDCDLATEVCCYDEAKGRARCVPNTGAGPRCEPGEQERTCDESSDCSAGARCCRSEHADADCSNRRERWLCNPGGCGQTGDPTDELCLPGAACARGACREGTVRTQLQGLCPPDTPSMACGAKQCAAGEVCCWSSKMRRGTCLSDAESCPLDYTSGLGRKLFFCRSPADCPTEECFSATGDSYNEYYECGESKCSSMINFLGPRLCRNAADCPAEIELSAMEGLMRKYHFTDCSADKDYPPGVKVCHYRPGVARLTDP